MKKLMLFASALAMLCVASCDELTDELLGDEDDQEQDGSSSQDDESTLEDQIAGYVKYIDMVDPTYGSYGSYTFEYDDQGRVSLIKGQYIDVYEDYEDEVESSDAAAKSLFSKVNPINIMKMRARMDDDLLATRSEDNYTYDFTISYTYTDSQVTVDYYGTSSEDDIDDETVVIYLNDNGFASYYTETSNWSSYSESYDSDGNVQTSVTNYVNSSEYTFNYNSDGYISDYRWFNECVSDDNDYWSYAYNYTLAWSGGNLSTFSYSNDDSSGGRTGVYTPSEELNNLSIDLVLVMEMGSDYVPPFNRNLFGVSATNLIAENVDTYLFDSDCYVSTYDYEYEAGILSNINMSWGWGSSEAEARENLELDGVLEFSYYE